jgi:hypothetical protein
VEVRLQATVYQHAASELKADVSVYGRRDRWRRAFTSALPLVGGAIITLPIPPLHFFSVPGCLVAAVVIALRRLKEERVFESALGPCPACGKHLELKLPSSKLPPYTLPCPGCGEFLKLSELR